MSVEVRSVRLLLIFYHLKLPSHSENTKIKFTDDRIDHLGLRIILQKLVCKCTTGFRRGLESQFPSAPRFPIKARKQVTCFLIRPADFEPIPNYVCINVALLQIDTEIKGANNSEKHPVARLFNSQRTSFRSRNVRIGIIGFLEIDPSFIPVPVYAICQTPIL